MRGRPLTPPRAGLKAHRPRTIETLEAEYRAELHDDRISPERRRQIEEQLRRLAAVQNWRRQ